MTDPRTVIGAPVFNKARWLGEAVESLLAQSERDFALVLIDDGSDDGSVEIAQGFAQADERVRVVLNERRLGMLGNTRRAFELPLELFPGAEFWALGSDHDVWHPRWLETCLGALESRPQVVLAYGLSRRIDENGDVIEASKSWHCDTRGLATRSGRLRHAYRRMAAGDMIYGLFRVEPLRDVGAYRSVLVPDRLLLSELALRGEFAQADEVLWHRRFRGLAELDRQRKAFWLDGEPWYSGYPWWLTHVGLFGWEYVWQRKGEGLGIDPRAGLRLTIDYLDVSVQHRLARRWSRVRKRAGQFFRLRRSIRIVMVQLGRWLRALLLMPRYRGLAERLRRVLRGRARAKLVELLDETAPRVKRN